MAGGDDRERVAVGRGLGDDGRSQGAAGARAVFHDHVLAELEAYAPLTSRDSYCVAFDTIVEDLPDDMFSDRPWGKGNNPKTAVCEYLKRLKEEGRKAVDGETLKFEIDRQIENKLLMTVAPDGYLKRV